MSLTAFVFHVKLKIDVFVTVTEGIRCVHEFSLNTAIGMVMINN